MQRVRGTYENIFPVCEFKIPNLFVDGEYVTLFWEKFAKTKEGEDSTYSSIEVFRVVNGQISAFWNPTHAESSNGVWG